MPSFGYAALLLVLRYVFYKVSDVFLSRKGKDGKAVDPKTAEKVQEEGYAIFGSVVMLSLGLYALGLSDGGDCGFSNTSGCFDSWPLTAPHPAGVALYYCAETGWYLHYLVKHELGLGMSDDAMMHVHHAATLSLITISFLLQLHRAGILVLTLLNISNPFLHVAKVAHYLDVGFIDNLLFLSFALVFFVTRLVVFPFVVLRATLIQSYVSQPAFLTHYLPVYATTNLLLGLLMVMQVMWMAAIVKLLTKALFGNKAEFKAVGAQVDFSRSKADLQGQGQGRGGPEAAAPAAAATAGQGSKKGQ